ncbi:hypothetical protein LOZ53_003929 [Ophidiomyces ophidiicola]|nr:hypothetical protein LOZ53_003929 [Ophidiomyces ophidiicola]
MGSEDLFNYTSGRWLYNEELRRAERRILFNVEQLKRVAAEAVGRQLGDVSEIKKLAEGGFNRSFEVVMCDGLQVIARLPYPLTVPKKYAIASEVATMDFVRRHDVPAPRVFKYSTTNDNEVGTEYIIMEKMHGQETGDVWYSMTDDQRIQLIREVVKLEARLFSIKLPASGSIYYSKDLDDGMEWTAIEGDKMDGLCIGPDVHYKWWYNERSKLQIDRCPYRTSEEVLLAGAKRELSWAEQYAHPRFPYEPLYREIYDFKKVSPRAHIDNLKSYLKIAKYLAPPQESYLNHHTLRHPDLQPNNILISDSFSITGLIDWQHCSILPLFLQAKLPKHFQNYGDQESEDLIRPQLPKDMDQLDPDEKEAAQELYRRRHVHFHYISFSKELNPDHINACRHPEIVLKQRLFEHSSIPWEGNNVMLKADLIKASKRWAYLLKESTSTKSLPPCPLVYEQNEIDKCLEIQTEQELCDRDMEISRMGIGVDEEGWVVPEMYETAKEKSKIFKEEVLMAAEPKDRAMIEKHWPFADRDEDE